MDLVTCCVYARLTRERAKYLPFVVSGTLLGECNKVFSAAACVVLRHDKDAATNTQAAFLCLYVVFVLVLNFFSLDKYSNLG